MAFEGLYVTYLAHDVTLRGIGLDGDGSREEDTWHGIWARVGMMYGLWRPNIPPFQPRRHTLELNATLKGMTSPF